MQYNIPRVSVDKTDELTDFEFDYEIALRNAWIEFLKEDNDESSVEFVKNGDKAQFAKGLSTDPVLYDEIKRRNEAGEFIDIKMPDFSNVPTLKKKFAEMQVGKAEEKPESRPDDFEPVDPSELFGGGPGA